MSELVLIDGAYGSSATSILYSSLCLTALTGRTVEIFNPGHTQAYMAQIRAIAAQCGGIPRVSTAGTFEFTPRHTARSGKYKLDTRPKGLATEIIPSILIPLSYATDDSNLTIFGSTHVSLPAEYFEFVYFPTLRRLGVQCDFHCNKFAFRRSDPGELFIQIKSSRIEKPLSLLKRSNLAHLTAYIAKSGVAAHVGRRGFHEIEKILHRLGLPVKAERRFIESESEGVALTLVAEFEGGSVGFSSFGEQGISMEKVAEQGCALFKKWYHSGASCDEQLAEHLVIPMALAPGESRILMSGDTAKVRAALYVAQEFLPVTSSIRENLDGTSLVTVQGCDYRPCQV